MIKKEIFRVRFNKTNFTVKCAVMAVDVESLKKWPTQPGIYAMKDGAGRILYIGKAKNLRNRIRSYFQSPEKLSDKTQVLVRKIISLEFTVTHTELEALLLECNLIKQHRPRYNVRLKDDKNFPYVVLDFTHPFPKLRVTRKVIPSPHLKYFGPYSGAAQEISRFLLKTFQIRDCSDAKFRNRTRPCLNYEIGTCTAPCVNLVSQEDYSRQCQEAVLFLKGKNKELLKKLEEQMSRFSEEMKYEKAGLIRDKIRTVLTLTEKQDAVLTERLKDIDIIGSYIEKDTVQWVVLFIRGGFLIGRRAERTPLQFDSFEETQRSFLEQFYQVSLIPDEVWLASDFPERELIQTYLMERSGKKVQVQVKRGEKPLRLLGMAHENAKLLYQERARSNAQSASEMLQEALGLAECPHTIEGIDVSNIQGTNPAVALVHFADERPLKSRYRIYYPKTIEGQDDFGMIHETLSRRLSKPDPPPPDLFMIDGGKGQLNAALAAMKEVGKSIPICSLAKARTESGFTRKEVEKSEERIFIPNRKNPILLREGNPALALLQRVRDEAHRFSVRGHQTRRRKKAFEDSELLQIEGIGEKLQQKLLMKFGNLRAIRSASEEELSRIGIPKNVIDRLRKE